MTLVIGSTALQQGAGVVMLIAVVSMLLSPSVAWTAMDYGDCVQGSIDVPGEEDEFFFSAEAGDVVILRMSEPDASLSPHLRLYSPADALIASAHGAYDARIQATLLTEGGTYSILAADYSGLHGGAYGLHLQCTSSPGQATALSFGDCVQDSVGTLGCWATYSFDGEWGERVSVRMSEPDDPLTPEIRLYGPDGSLVTFQDANAYDARLDAVLLTETGTYTLLAGDRYGYHYGDYGLHVQCTSSPGQATALSFGDCVQDSVGTLGCWATYSFDGEWGERVSVRMSEPDDPLTPEIRLYGPDGSLVTFQDANAYDARLDAVLLTETGTYTLLAGDRYGYHYGDYGLHVQCTSSPGQATALSFGDCVQDSVGTLGCWATYSFDGEWGERVSVRMSEPDDPLTPEIRLYGPDGSLVTFQDANAYDARLDAVLLTETGTYTLLAGDRYGYHYGDYGLHVQCTSSPGQATALSFGDCVQDSVGTLGCWATYSFDGEWGERVSVRMSEPDDPLTPEIRLYGPDGSLVTFHDANAYDARLDAVLLTETGTYTLLAGDRYGYHYGDYGLHVQCTSSPGQATALSFGDCVQDSVGTLACWETYTFSGSAGDSITTWMLEINPLLSPEIRLYTPDGSLLCTAGGADEAWLTDVSLDTSGVYALLAGDHRGYQMGAYSLCLIRAATGVPDDVSSDEMDMTRFVRVAPNPTSGDAEFHFRVAAPAQAKLSVYSPAGRLVYCSQELLVPNHHVVSWKPQESSSGVFFYLVEVGHASHRGAIVLVR